MHTLILIAIPTIAYLLTWWFTGWALSPDGVFYLKMSKKEVVPLPYAQRWLLPWLLRTERAWTAMGVLSTIMMPFLTALYVGGSFSKQILAELLFIGLPGIWRLNVRLPILVDPTAMCLALLAAILEHHGHSSLAILAVLLGTAVKETTPIFAAIFTGSWLPLLGISAVLVCWSCWVRNGAPGKPEEPWLQHPVREARKVHDFFHALAIVAPWGAVAVLAYFAPWWSFLGLIAALALVAGYGQLLAAQDNARLFQWAAPAVIALVLQHPPSWVWPVAFLGLFNPYRGT
jgi:hypothetical protein